MLCMPTLLASLHVGLVTPSRPTAAVIGGGPAGLAAAYTLAERNFDVSVFEQRPQPSMYEAQKAYLYLIDGRGQRFTTAAGLADELSSPENSVSSLNYTVTRCMPDGSRVAVVPPILEPTTSPSWWIPRQRFLALLVGAIKRLNGRRDPSTDHQSTGRVELFFGSEVLGVSRTASGGVEVHARTEDGGETTVQPLLLVGADGINSLVRRRCAEWSEADATLGARAADFTPRHLPSPSSGLLYKMLRLPPAFRLDGADAALRAEPRKAYSFRPAPRAPLGPTRLGLLPVADADYPRTANVILPPEHPVWAMESGGDVKAWLRETFPQLPMDELVSDDEAADFAATRAGAFPAPAYSPQQHLLLPSSAVCLVGDSVAAFPPDIGQGVNCALSSVMMLATALDGHMGTPAASSSSAAPAAPAAPAPASDGDARGGDVARLHDALTAYGRACAPEAEAVARIAQVGFPYQYPITREKHPLQKVGWFANFFARTFVLAKLLPRLFSPAVIVLVQRSHLSYGEAWALAERTTRRMRLLGAGLLAGLLALLSSVRPWVQVL